MKKLIIAGGTGYLGNVLTTYFTPKVDTIIILTRSLKKEKKNLRYIPWDAKTLGPWVSELEHADALINLTGKSVNCRYTKKNKKLILQSRIASTEILNKACSQCKNPPKIWLNSSTATIYKHSKVLEMDEINGVYGTGFSVQVAKAWENSFFDPETPKIRKIALRTSIVLGKNGGALPPMINLVKFGFSGKQASGSQKFSWIHEIDFARSINFILQQNDIKGIVNLAAPKPTTNRQLMQQLRTVLGMPFGISLPKFLLEIGARIIRTETELVLKSRNVIPKKLLDHGYTFTHPKLQPALTGLNHKNTLID